MTIDLPVQKKAEELLRDDTYLYWRDDTHWNEHGIAAAAEVIAAEIRATPGGRQEQ